MVYADDKDNQILCTVDKDLKEGDDPTQEVVVQKSSFLCYLLENFWNCMTCKSLYFMLKYYKFNAWLACCQYTWLRVDITSLCMPCDILVLVFLSWSWIKPLTESQTSEQLTFVIAIIEFSPGKLLKAYCVSWLVDNLWSPSNADDPELTLNLMLY